MTKDKLKKITNYLMNAMFTDGAHHKQYHVGQALIEIFGSKEAVLQSEADTENLSLEDFIEEYVDEDYFWGIPS